MRHFGMSLDALLKCNGGKTDVAVERPKIDGQTIKSE